MEGRYTRIRQSFWMDDKVHEWPGDTKLLALYLLTSPHNNMLGCYFLPRLYICGDLGWELGQLFGPLERLLADGFIKYDERCRLVMLTNYLRHNPLHNGNRAKAAIKLLQGLPKSSLLNYLRSEVEQQDKPYLEQLAQALGRLAPAPPEQRLAKPVGERIGEPLGEPMGEPYAKPSMEWFGIPFEEPMAEPFDEPSAEHFGKPLKPDAKPISEPFGKPMGERYAKPTTTATATTTATTSTSTANTTVTANKNINMPAAVNISIPVTAAGAEPVAANLPVTPPLTLHGVTPAAANTPVTLPAATATAKTNNSAGLCAFADIAPEGTLALEAGQTLRPMDSEFKRVLSPSIALLILAALTPNEHEVYIEDENVGKLNLEDSSREKDKGQPQGYPFYSRQNPVRRSGCSPAEPYPPSGKEPLLV